MTRRRCPTTPGRPQGRGEEGREVVHMSSGLIHMNRGWVLPRGRREGLAPARLDCLANRKNS
jgi:hypothetical protein